MFRTVLVHHKVVHYCTLMCSLIMDQEGPNQVKVMVLNIIVKLMKIVCICC